MAERILETAMLATVARFEVRWINDKGKRVIKNPPRFDTYASAKAYIESAFFAIRENVPNVVGYEIAEVEVDINEL